MVRFKESQKVVFGILKKLVDRLPKFKVHHVFMLGSRCLVNTLLMFLGKMIMQIFLDCNFRKVFILIISFKARSKIVLIVLTNIIVNVIIV